MKLISNILLVCFTLLIISACNSSVDRFSLLKQCTVLGDESIIYARAHYVKLFYHFNPNKFSDSYRQINNFDAVTHKNTINTYVRAVKKFDNDKHNIDDDVTQNLLNTCKSLSTFSTNFVEENYRLAINHISKNDPLTDTFFIEINKIVKFDHNIGTFDTAEISFKQNVDNYQKAISEYINRYRKDIPTEFINQRGSKDSN